MVFYLIGLGLGDPKDITLRGLEVVRQCTKVYLESYTSIITGGKQALEAFYGREVFIADREDVEQRAEELLRTADVSDVALLVVGDPFGATTHTDLALRARQMGISVEVINNASILTAIGSCGLDLNHFGEVVSIPFWQDDWKPDSFLDKINRNLKKKLHTLCLLDIKVKEQTWENLMKGRSVFEPPRFMRVDQATQQLLQAIYNRRDKSINEIDATEKLDSDLNETTKCVGLARVGMPSQSIRCGTLKDLSEIDLGEPLQSVIICSDLKSCEEDALNILGKLFSPENISARLGYTEKNIEVPEPDTKGDAGQDTDSRAIGKLHLIGIGIGNVKNITMNGLECVRNSAKVYVECSIMIDGSDEMDPTAFFGKEVKVWEESDREAFLSLVKSGSQVSLLLNGDVCNEGLTLGLEFLRQGLAINMVHNASLEGVIGCCGLQLYTFGKTVHLPTYDCTCWDDVYNEIVENLDCEWHTLCLPAITSNCPSTLNMGESLHQSDTLLLPQMLRLLEVGDRRKMAGVASPLMGNHQIVLMAGLGTANQKIITGSLHDLASHCNLVVTQWQCLILTGHMHPLEEEFLEQFQWKST